MKSKEIVEGYISNFIDYLSIEGDIIKIHLRKEPFEPLGYNVKVRITIEDSDEI